MSILLFVFAIPVAIIILSGILETLIKSPIKISGIFFSIFLVVAFIFGAQAEYIVGVLIYTIISFVVAYIVKIIMNKNCYNIRCIKNTFDNYDYDYNSLPQYRYNNENNTNNNIKENENINFNNNFSGNNYYCRRYK